MIPTKKALKLCNKLELSKLFQGLQLLSSFKRSTLLTSTALTKLQRLQCSNCIPAQLDDNLNSNEDGIIVKHFSASGAANQQNRTIRIKTNMPRPGWKTNSQILSDVYLESVFSFLSFSHHFVRLLSLLISSMRFCLSTRFDKTLYQIN